MSQAENTPTTSRRSFMRTAVAASAALPTAAAAFEQADELSSSRALEAEVSQGWEYLGSACAIFAPAEQKLWAWEKQNPKPTMREPTPAESKEFMRRLTQRMTEPGPWQPSTYGDAYKKDEAEYERALAAWEQRRESAKEET